MLLIGLFQIFVPLLLIGVIAFVRQSNRLRWVLITLAYGMVIGFMWLIAPWHIVSMYFRTLYPILFIVASVIGYRRIRTPVPPPGKFQIIFETSINLLLIVFMGGLIWQSLRGYPMPANAINLTSPLRNGRYVVGHGGASPFINAHAKVRPQNYALDILGLNALGMRAIPFGNRGALGNYTIFGVTLYSPCTGTIAAVVDQYEDLIPPDADTEHPAGNYILIECEDAEVLLAHMKKGSLKGRVGDVVTTDTVLGQVGNTGNTSEPHLHIHAERGGEPGVILDGEAVPITIGGRFLVRGDIIIEK